MVAQYDGPCLWLKQSNYTVPQLRESAAHPVASVIVLVVAFGCERKAIADRVHFRDRNKRVVCGSKLLDHAAVGVYVVPAPWTVVIPAGSLVRPLTRTLARPPARSRSFVRSLVRPFARPRGRAPIRPLVRASVRPFVRART